MHIFEINILILNFDILYMFRTRGFIYRKRTIYKIMVRYFLRIEITIKGFCKISEYKILNFLNISIWT
jgi:hypothetical protein